MRRREQDFMGLMRRFQIDWICFLGWSRTFFLCHFVMSTILLPFCVWLSFFSGVPAAVDSARVSVYETGLVLAQFIMSFVQMFMLMCRVFPFAFAMMLIVSLVTGMLGKVFWTEVEKKRANLREGV